MAVTDCVDFRGLNVATSFDAEHMPGRDDHLFSFVDKYICVEVIGKCLCAPTLKVLTAFATC